MNPSQRDPAPPEPGRTPSPGPGAGRTSNLDPLLAARTPPLPIAWYFDPEWLERERSLLFARGPNHTGHECMVPRPGDYRVLPAGDDGRVLVRDTEGVRLLSNVCRHRQARLLDGHGHADPIVCPLHRWTYGLDGRLLGAPDFAQAPDCALPCTPLTRWQGLLFAGPRDAAADLADFPLTADYDFTGHVLDRVVVDECPFNWKTFLEIYLELYHVEAAHPGLQRWVDAGRYRWHFGARWSAQVLGLKDDLQQQVSPHYARYRDAILAWSGGVLPKYGSIWSILYPNVMLEWYPCSLVVSTLIPRSPEHTTNVVEFYYPEAIHAFERPLVEAHQAAYAESGAEDAAICARLQSGRRALFRAGEDDAGPFQQPHEDGMIHFHDWLRREMGQRRAA